MADDLDYVIALSREHYEEIGFLPMPTVQSQCEKCGMDLVPCCPICSMPKPLNWQAAEQGYKLVPVPTVQRDEPPFYDFHSDNGVQTYVRYQDWYALRSLLVQREERIRELEKQLASVDDYSLLYADRADRAEAELERMKK